LRTDEGLRRRMELRTRITDAVRMFFSSRNFLEVETPIVMAHPGMEPYLDPFRTSVIRNDGRRFDAALITSPEYSMKKLLAGGLEKIFTITKVFRNGEPFGGGHNPEFTMIEWYRANADYRSLMADTEQMASEVAQKTLGTTKIRFGGQEIDLAPPWRRMTVAEAMKRHAGIDLDRAIDDYECCKADAILAGHTITADDAFDDIFFKIFLRDVEPKFGPQPLILHDYPRSMAALARMKPGDARYAERVEAYVGGMELCNGFSELNDSAEQRRRLEEESVLRRKLGRHDHGIDEQFVEAVGMMPESAGIALGIDRLVMLLADASDIVDVLFFPARDLFSK
ncbi:MAG: EF-P lysine aminoacylase EpmA, partial [Patescibacteria group bacterium]